MFLFYFQRPHESLIDMTCLFIPGTENLSVNYGSDVGPGQSCYRGSLSLTNRDKIIGPWEMINSDLKGGFLVAHLSLGLSGECQWAHLVKSQTWFK